MGRPSRRGVGPSVRAVDLHYSGDTDSPLSVSESGPDGAYLSGKHPSVGVEERELVGCAYVTDHECPLVDTPQPLATSELGQLGDLHRRQAEHLAARLCLVEGLVVQDARGGVA